MAVNMFITLAACEFLLAPPMNLLPAYYVVGFFFFQCMSSHVPTCPWMKLNLGRPEELVVYYSYETVLMHSPFLISSSGESILLKGLFVRVYLLPAYTCTFLAS